MLKINRKFVTHTIVFTVLTFILLGCESRPKGVLDEQDMTSILTELYILDGSFDAKGLTYNDMGTKSKYYNSVLEKYEISEAQFDSSVMWYTKNPKKYEKIFENIDLRLTAMQNDINNGKYHPLEALNNKTTKVNLWNKRVQYILTKDSTRTKLNFEITNDRFLYNDIYILKFLQRIAPEDSCENQYTVLRINYSNGKTDSLMAISHNDSLLRRYTFKLKATKKLVITSISGEILASKKYKGKLNAELDSISFVREYNPTLQDSLLKIVQKADTLSFKKPTKTKTDTSTLNKPNLKKPIKALKPII